MWNMNDQSFQDHIFKFISTTSMLITGQHLLYTMSINDFNNAVAVVHTSYGTQNLGKCLIPPIPTLPSSNQKL